MRSRLWVLLVPILVLMTCRGFSQSVWTGGGAGPQWSIGGNWQGGAAPVPGPLTSLTFDGSVTQTVNDFQPGSFFSNLTFAASSAPFNLSGNPFILCGNLANNSTGRQRIAADVAWSGVSRTLDTGAGDVVLAGHLTSGAGNAAFTKNGSGRLILEGGANFTAVDPVSKINGGSLIVASDAVFNRLDLQNNASLIITNNATLSGFTASYVFWQACTVDLYSGRIVVGNSLLTAQDRTKTCVVNVRGGVFTAGGAPRWSNNGNTLLTLSGDGLFEWLATGQELAENGGSHVILNGGMFKFSADGAGEFDVGYRLSNPKRDGTITNRIDFNAGLFLTGGFKHSAKTNLLTTLAFNGGTVRAGKTTAGFFGARPDLLDSRIQAGGLVLDTQGFAVTLNDALESGATPDGGLIQLGGGTLTLAADCTYTGPTVVSNGTLTIQAAVASESLRLAPFTTATVVSNGFFAGSLTVGGNARFLFTPGMTDSLSLTGMTLGDAQGAGQLVFEVTDEENTDRLDVTGPLDLSGKGDVFLYQPGTTTAFTANGTYALITFSGALTGSASDLRVANPDPTKQYAFTESDGVISVTISERSGARWIADADGDWSVPGNWDGPVPNAAGAFAAFLTNATAPVTVTLDAPVTVGNLVLSNNVVPYTFSGTNVLTFDSGSQPSFLSLQSGQHEMAVPWVLADEMRVETAAGASLTLSDAVSGIGPMTVTGAGGVTLLGTNQTLTLLRNGFLSIADGAALAGGVTFDNGTLEITQSTVLDAPLEVGLRGAGVRPATNVTLTLASESQGGGKLRQNGSGALSLAAPLGNIGGVSVESGTLLFTNDVFGSMPLELAGGTARYAGSENTTLGNPLVVSASSQLAADSAGLTLDGPVAFPAVATLGLDVPNGLTLAGQATLSESGRKLHLLRGTLRFAAGADYTLFSGARDTLKLGQDANAATELVIEEGARLRTGGIHLNTTLADATQCVALVRQEGGIVEVTDGQGLFIRDYGYSDGIYQMNGGIFTAPVSSWTSVGSKGPGYLTVNGGTMTLGRFAMGVNDFSSHVWNGPGGHLAINNGRLTIAGQCSWMSDAYRSRYNTVVLGNGTPESGELNLVATTRAVPYASGQGGRTAFTFNGGVLKTIGVAPYEPSSLSDYLFGVDTLTLRSGGAIIETPHADVALQQPLRAAEPMGGLIKRGTAALTLAHSNNVWCGETVVQAGTLRARLNQRPQRLYPEGLLALWTFDDGTSNDQSGNGFHLLQQNDTNLVSFVEGGALGKAARFTGLSSLKMAYTSVFDITSFTVSAWFKLASKGGHQGIFSGRVNAAENSTGGTFDFKYNDGDYISNLIPGNSGHGAHIKPETGGRVAIGEWHMVTYVVVPGRVDAYLDGEWKAYTNGLTSALLTPGFLLTLGRGIATSDNPNREMMRDGGMIDDVAVFSRALTAAEIATLCAEAVTPRPAVRVGESAVYDLLGSTNDTPSVAGGGTISNGVLAVSERLEPEGEMETATHTVSHLLLDSTNLIYACTVTDTTNDLVRVSETLEVRQAGSIDLGRTELDPLSTPWRRTVMTFGAIDAADAARLSRWKVTGDGITGKNILRTVIVDTAQGTVDVELRFAGTFMLLR